MAQDRSGDGTRHCAVFDMYIAGTDRCQRYFNDRIPVIQDLRNRAVLQCDFAISLIYDCFHD